MKESSQLVRFELEMLGGQVERRYRKLRPDLEGLPWGSLAKMDMPREIRLDAQRRWTRLAFNEYGSAAGMMLMMRALAEAQAPLDLMAYGSRFAIDELAHAELGALMAMELGGATEILYDPVTFLPNDGSLNRDVRPLLRAAEVVIRVSCIDEVLSLALLHGLWRATREPLARGVFRAILRDEAEHAAFGTAFLDWAAPQLIQGEHQHLTEFARAEIDRRRERTGPSAEVAPHDGNPLAWIDSRSARDGQIKALSDRVAAPLRARGL